MSNTIQFGSCKSSGTKADLQGHRDHVGKFVTTKAYIGEYQSMHHPRMCTFPVSQPDEAPVAPVRVSSGLPSKCNPANCSGTLSKFISDKRMTLERTV